MIGVQCFVGNFQVNSINTTIGVQTAIGNSGIDRLNSLIATPSGTLYSVRDTFNDQSLLVRINPLTGVGTDLGAITWQATRVNTPSSDYPNLQSIAFDSDGTLWGIGHSMSDISGSGRIYTIDRITGAATLKFGLGLSNNFRGTDFLPTPVPVPVAVRLFGSGLVGLVGLARRTNSATHQ